MTEEKEVIHAVDRFCKTLKKFGVKKVTSALETLYRKKETDYEQQVIDFIKNETCKELNITVDDIYRTRITGDTHVCRSISIILIKKHLDLSHLEVSHSFQKKNHVVVSQSLHDFKNKNPKIKDDKIFIDIYNKVNSRVEEYIKKLT